jgi:hypothetical protein
MLRRAATDIRSQRVLATSRFPFAKEPPRKSRCGQVRGIRFSSSSSMRRRRSGVTSKTERSGTSGRAVPPIVSDAMISAR